MASPKLGQRYVYSANVGLAEVLSRQQLTSEQCDLDMHPGTEVRVEALVPADVTGAHDDTEDSVVVAWSDRSGNPRQTSVGVERFGELFESLSEAVNGQSASDQ